MKFLQNRSIVYLCKAQITQKKLSNQLAFCWSTWQIHMTNLNPLWNLCGGNFRPHCEIPNCVDSYWNGCISPQKSPNNGQCDRTFSLMLTCENSGWLGTERLFSRTNPGVLWDTGVEAVGCGLGQGSMSIGSSSLPCGWSSGGADVSIGDSAASLSSTWNNLGMHLKKHLHHISLICMWKTLTLLFFCGWIWDNVRRLA